MPQLEEISPPDENSNAIIWEAENFAAIPSSGRTMPLQVGCFRRVEPDGKKLRKEFLLKSVGHPEVAEISLFCEFAGNVLAQHFGIRTPNPALVNLSSAFVAATQRNSEFLQIAEGKINLRPGTAVGCEYLSGLAPVARDFEATLPRDINEAARIFAFDMLVQNPDRTFTGSINMAFSSNRLLAFDFELCFSFLFLIGGALEPWRIDAKMARDHLLYRSLKGKVVDWKDFLSDLASLDSGKIEQLFATLLEKFPGCVRSAEKIMSHLLQIREHSADFKRELERSLV